MPQRCVVCNHPEKEEIEKMLEAKMSYSKMIIKFKGLNKANISRHFNNHMKRD